MYNQPQKHELVLAVATPALVGAWLQEAGGIATLRKLGQLLARHQLKVIGSSIDDGMSWVTDDMSRQGIKVAVSPAVSRVEHAQIYRLPHTWADVTIYTGAGDNTHMSTAIQASHGLLIPWFHPDLWGTIRQAVRAGVPTVLVQADGQLTRRTIQEACGPTDHVRVTDSVDQILNFFVNN